MGGCRQVLHPPRQDRVHGALRAVSPHPGQRLDRPADRPLPGHRHGGKEVLRVSGRKRRGSHAHGGL